VGGARQLGQEWLVDASGCDPQALRDAAALASIFESLVVTLKLKVIGSPQWHTFPGPGGITGLALLSESHLGIHTFPEHGFAALSVYSCRTREAPDFEALLQKALGATHVSVRTVPRGPK
jgi:S-adenosylmethionine decarboxylase